MSFHRQTTDKRFRLELAAKLGMTAGELGDRMTPREFTDWQVLAQVEGEEAANEAEKQG